MTPQLQNPEQISPDTLPLVSICIPTYNRADMVSKAISSALGQTYSNIEILVVDNASSDDIQEVVASFNDPRITFYKNDRNLGLFGNFNRCIELSRGKYVHILHSDDWIDPEFTELCTQHLESHPDVAMTFTSLKIHTGDKTESFMVSNATQIFPVPEGFRQILLRRGFISCPSVMVRKNIYDKIGFFSLEYPYSADYYQWMKISLKFKISYIHNAYLHYRQGEHSESYRLLFKSPLGYIDTLKNFIQIIKDLEDSYPLFRKEINTAIFRFIGDCIYAGYTRIETMENVSPQFFSGLAKTASALIQSATLLERMSVIKIQIVIFLSAICFSIPIFRSGIGRCIRKKTKKTY